MGIFDKVTDISKKVADKAGEVAKSAVEKGSEVINDGKTAIEVAQEEAKIKELVAQIGAFVVSKIDEGGEPCCSEVAELYSQIVAKRKVVEEKKNK